jgi:hypothetical protein
VSNLYCSVHFMVLIIRMTCGMTRAYSSICNVGIKRTNPFHQSLNDELEGISSTADTKVSTCALEYSCDCSIAAMIRMRELYSLAKSPSSSWSCTNDFHMSDDRDSGAWMLLRHAIATNLPRK